MSTDASGYQPRRAFRSSEDRLLGGVASGLALHLGVDVLWTRAAFVVAAAVGGLGLVAYAGLWLLLPSAAHLEQSSPGLEAATRQGRRPRRGRRFQDVGPVVALAAVGVGVVVLVQSLLGVSFFFWPLLVGVVGLAVLWRQADEAQRERWVDSSGRIDVRRAVLGRGGIASYARLAAGFGLLLVALLLFAAHSGGISVARDVLVAGILGVAGLALVAGPWLVRLLGDLAEERAARVRTQERADVAAHLHDSVLQTLALIQKNAADSATVARLARAQERDLRSWLYDDQAAGAPTLAAALRTAAAEVEDTHATPVEVVSVGDTVMVDRLAAVVQAAREAMVNAAKHSGADRVDVYAEVAGGRAEVYVRDRGVGFEPAMVPPDRMGIRRSIEGRMSRHGGTAEVRTRPGEGTEVRLGMPVGADGQEA